MVEDTIARTGTVDDDQDLLPGEILKRRRQLQNKLAKRVTFAQVAGKVDTGFSPPNPELQEKGSESPTEPSREKAFLAEMLANAVDQEIGKISKGDENDTWKEKGIKTASSTESDVESQASDDLVVSSHDEEEDSCRSNCSFCSTVSSPSPTSSLEHIEQSDKSDENNGEMAHAGDPCHATDKHFIRDDTTPPPVVAEEWQVSHTFNKEGGCLRQSNSDVILRVPANAVLKSPVEVHAAVCADVAHIRHELKLSDDEEVVSPLAEYWAGADFHFSRPVTVELPHCLSADYNPERVHVYHVSRNQQGGVCLSKLNREADAVLCNSGEVTNRGEQFFVSDRADSTELPLDKEDVLSVRSLATTDLKQQTSSNNATEALGTSRISPHGVVTILTDTFCGYVCVVCNGKEKKRPQLYTMGCVSDCSERLIHVSAHVWDRRLKIKDFRKAYGIEQRDKTEPLLLLDDIAKSKLYMRLRLPESSGISHKKDESGNPFLPISKDCGSPGPLGCWNCIKKGRISPLSNKWMLESRDSHALRPSQMLAVDISHVAANVTPSWKDRDGVEKLKTITIQVPEMGSPHTRQWTSVLQELSTAHLGVIANKLGVPARCSAEADYREQLTTSIIREGPSRFSLVLASLLSQISLGQRHELPDASSTDLETVFRTDGRERSCDEIMPQVYQQTGSQARGVQETAFNESHVIQRGNVDSESVASNTDLKTVFRTNTRERSCDEIMPQVYQQNGSQAREVLETAFNESHVIQRGIVDSESVASNTDLKTVFRTDTRERSCDEITPQVYQQNGFQARGVQETAFNESHLIQTMNDDSEPSYISSEAGKQLVASSTQLKTVLRTNTKESWCDEITSQVCQQNGHQARRLQETASNVSGDDQIHASNSRSTSPSYSLPLYSIGQPSTVDGTLHTENHGREFSSANSSAASTQKITDCSLTRNDAMAETLAIHNGATNCHETFSTLSLSDSDFCSPESESGNAEQTENRLPGTKRRNSHQECSSMESLSSRKKTKQTCKTQ